MMTVPACIESETALARFLAKVDRSGECWLWTAATTWGYGMFFNGERQTRAHRWAYEHFVGPIPAELAVDHLCRVRACVNPDHLEPVPQRENVIRGQIAMGRALSVRTHCIHGHEYNGVNTRYRPDGGTDCRVCDKHQAKARRTAARC